MRVPCLPVRDQEAFRKVERSSEGGKGGERAGQRFESVRRVGEAERRAHLRGLCECLWEGDAGAVDARRAVSRRMERVRERKTVAGVGFGCEWEACGLRVSAGV